MPLIRLRGVTKVYGEGALAFAALKGVDLDIARGDFVAIMGPSGSGKSTAMNTLGCLDRPTTGDYLFQGVHVESLTRDERARLRRRFFGFVFQGFNLLARTTAQENVELPLLYRGESAAVRRQAAAQALDAVGLKGWEHHTPAELSGGQQQRVAIARAIVTNPAVLLADEPTGNLDTQRSVEIMELIARLNRERGITVIMVTHEPDMAAYARRVVRFVDGVVESDRLNPERASYGISDYVFAISQLAQTTLRSEVGKIDLDRTFEERTNINIAVVAELDKASEPWGVKVLRYEIKNITPPADVLAAMEKQMRAEREKRAVILTSEGQRDAAINSAEGEKQQTIKASEARKQQQINEAEGQAAAILAVATATAEGIKRVAEATQAPGGQEAIQLRVAEQYIGEFGKVINNADTIILPSNVADVASMITTAMSVVSQQTPSAQQRR